MSDIYVFSKDEENNDYDSMGLAGALVATECIFKEAANGESTVTLKHPLDDFGRYEKLQNGNILVVPVPVRTTPEIENGHVVTTVWTYKVKPLNLLTAKSQRTLYKKATGNKKYRVLAAGEKITVVYKPDEEGGGSNNTRWKVKTRFGTGWMYSTGLEDGVEHQIADNSESIQEVMSPWTVMPQLFRIYEVKKSLKEVNVSARHISYDLLYNVTKYENGNSVKLQAAIDGVLNNTYATHDFHGYTNVDNEQVGLYYNGKNPIEAFLDPEAGLCTKYDVGLVRDNKDLYFLHDPGINRGVRIQYGKNMTSIDFTESEDEVVTRIIPVGETKNGNELYLGSTTESQYIDVSEYVTQHPEIASEVPNYPVAHVHWLKCDNCKVGDKDSDGGTITTAIARARMRDQANKLFANKCYSPKIELKVEFVNLGDTDDYKQFKNLENCFLFDYVIVQHPRLNVDVTSRIESIEWDCLKERMKTCSIGSVGKTLSNTGITSWQVPNGFSGSKIATKTIEGRSVKTDAIAADHIQSNTINTTHLNAENITAFVLDAIKAHFQDLTAGRITTDELYASIAQIAAAEVGEADINHANVKSLATAIAAIADAQIEHADISTAVITDANVQILAAALANITRADIETANVQNALIDWAGIENLSAQVAAISKSIIGSATIADATIDWADIKDVSAQLATIAQARIDQAEISQAQIDQLHTSIVDAITLTAQNANFDFASAQRLVASAMILEQGVGGSVTIANLAATNAMFVQATLGTLVLKGEDENYYEVTVTADGDMHTKQVQPTQEEIAEGEMANGRKIVETEAYIAELNAENIRAQSAVVGEIFTAALTAEKISASEAFLASATIPELYVTSITALGDNLDLSANESINLVVESLNNDMASVQVKADEAMDAVKDLIVGGQNLVNDSEIITITIPANTTTASKLIASNLESGTAYTISMSSIVKEGGNSATLKFKGIQNGSTTLIEKELDLTGGYQKHTFMTNQKDGVYDLYFSVLATSSVNEATITISKVKLEVGTVATMWNKSLYDTEQRLKDIEGQLRILNNGFSYISTHTSNPDDEYDMKTIDGQLKTISAYLTFSTDNLEQPVLTIGSTGSDMKMELTNNVLTFLHRGSPVAYFSDNKLYITHVEAIEKISIGSPTHQYLDIVTTDTGVGLLWRS